MNIKLFTLMLESAQYKVIWAESAEIGLVMAEKEKPNLILMDIGLPGIDGLEATRRLKANPATRSIPVIAVTAHSLQSDRDDAIKAGCLDFVAKPVRMKEFLAIIHTHVTTVSAPPLR